MKRLLILLIGLLLAISFCFSQEVMEQSKQKSESTTEKKEAEWKGFNLQELSEQQIELMKNIVNDNQMVFCITKPISEFLEEEPPNAMAKQLTQNVINDIKNGKDDREVLLQLKRSLRRARAMPARNPATVYDINIKNSPYRGPENAKVTIVEFSDFQCPYCAKLFKELDQLAEKFPDDVKHVFKNFPLERIHKSARLAAKAALAAKEQGKFWEMRKKLFENYRAINKESIKKFAEELELDMEKFEQSLNKSEHDQIIDEDLIDGELVDVGGTPSIYINGRIYQGNRSIGDFESYVKGILAAEAETKTP